MWTVFIADDEPKIRRRLHRLVETFGGDFTVCGEAGDGIEALERIGDELPDILLVDICMPRLNGLDFIERIGDEASASVIIVVSGHDEFEYAQRAVQLPIFEYVLKPVEAAPLEAILNRAAGLLTERRKKNGLLQWAEQEVGQNRDEMVQELFADWIHGYSGSGEIAERRRLLGFDETASVRILGVQPNAFCHGINALELKEHKVLQLAVKRLVEEFLATRGLVTSFEDRRDHVFFLIEEVLTDEVCEALRKEIRIRLNLPARVGFGEVRMGYEEFVEDYEELCRRVEGPRRDGRIVRKVYDYMQEHFNEASLDLESAAAALALSPGYVSRLLKQNTGYGFSEFTNRFRILEAIRMMNTGDMLMYEIAEAVGYSSQHYFSRIFRRITGRSPAEYAGRGEECHEK